MLRNPGHKRGHTKQSQALLVGSEPKEKESNMLPKVVPHMLHIIVVRSKMWSPQGRPLCSQFQHLIVMARREHPHDHLLLQHLFDIDTLREPLHDEPDLIDLPEVLDHVCSVLVVLQVNRHREALIVLKRLSPSRFDPHFIPHWHPVAVVLSNLSKPRFGARHGHLEEDLIIVNAAGTARCAAASLQDGEEHFPDEILVLALGHPFFFQSFQLIEDSKTHRIERRIVPHKKNIPGSGLRIVLFCFGVDFSPCLLVPRKDEDNGSAVVIYLDLLRKQWHRSHATNVTTTSTVDVRVPIITVSVARHRRMREARDQAHWGFPDGKKHNA
mmetsp:Transcript_177745/g.564021  ORF Transcript_177745/g.564021 Transcript_177745/m.564021 type:complete len:327 (+) Transcript_177745:1769-2749(+)